MIVFYTAWENEYTFGFLLNEETEKTYFSEFEQSIEVTERNLYLVNWTDLTFSLQFKDTKLPDERNKDLKIDIENGFYKVVIKQLFDPEDEGYDPENKINFIIEFFIQPINPNLHAEKIMWTEDFPNDDSYFLNDEPNEFDDFLKKLVEKDKKQ